MALSTRPFRRAGSSLVVTSSALAEIRVASGLHHRRNPAPQAAHPQPFKPEVESSILSGRMSVHFGLCRFVLQIGTIGDLRTRDGSAVCWPAQGLAVG